MCCISFRGFIKLSIIAWCFVQIGIIVAYLVTFAKWFDVKPQFWAQVVDFVIPTVTLVTSFFIKAERNGAYYDGKEGASPTWRLRFVIGILILVRV